MDWKGGADVMSELGRRYFRFFKFLDCFEKAYECFVNGEGVVVVGKWSFLGCYLGLESLTIVSLFSLLIASLLGGFSNGCVRKLC